MILCQNNSLNNDLLTKYSDTIEFLLTRTNYDCMDDYLLDILDK